MPASAPAVQSKSDRRSAWASVREEVIAALDIRQEYISWGLRIAGEPNDEGWIPCHSLTREDNTPSCGINVSSGFYKDFADANESRSFFYAAADFGRLGNNKEALHHYAAKAGVKLPTSEDTANWDSKVEWQKWLPQLCHLYSQRKKPITSDAFERMGARRGKWPKESSNPESVFALPVYGPSLVNADPTGWVLVHAYGHSLTVFGGEGKPPKVQKSHTLGGTRGGLMNRFALEHLATAEVVWKVEGVSDCLTLESIIPEELRGRHVVVTNSGGSNEKPRAEFAALFAGKDVRVLHDADNAGQTGAAGWTAGL